MPGSPLSRSQATGHVDIVPVTILDRENSAIAAREEKPPKIEECVWRNDFNNFKV